MLARGREGGRRLSGEGVVESAPWQAMKTTVHKPERVGGGAKRPWGRGVGSARIGRAHKSSVRARRAQEWKRYGEYSGVQ